MKRFTALLLSAILLCSSAGGLAAQNSGESDKEMQNSEESGQDVQNSEESGQDEQNTGEPDKETQDAEKRCDHRITSHYTV